jgi:hypothetical protein
MLAKSKNRADAEGDLRGGPEDGVVQVFQMQTAARRAASASSAMIGQSRE